MVIDKWMVYFINSGGFRDGTEYIEAKSKAEALAIYKRFFNVPDTDECRAIPVVGR